MKIARKAAVSLLICVLLFAGFCIFAFTSLFDIIETRFYDNAILNELKNELADDTDFIDSYISDLQKRFSDILLEDAIRRSFWVNQSSEDIYERSRIFASLGVSLPGLQWVRFVDSGGNRIHYSNNPDDQIITNDGTILYKNYPEVSGYLPFDQRVLSGVNMEHILFDDENERLVFYYPFYDSMDIQRGEALFSVSIRAFSERLAENRQIKVSDNVSVISDPDGIVIGIPLMEITPVKEAIAAVWASGGAAISRVYTPQSDPLTLLSAKTSQGIFIGHLVPEKLFAFPDVLKALLVAAVFITLFVVMFLIFNVKPDAVAVVQSRLKELQVSLMHEYYQLMGDMDWAVWRRELEQRREDVKSELCRGLKIKKGSGIESYINSFFDRSWDSLLAAIGSRTGMITTFDEAKLEAILGRVLGSSRPSYAGDDRDYKDSGQNNGFEGIMDDDILDDDIASIAERYDDIEELAPADEAPWEAPPAVAGVRYDDIEELAPADEAPWEAPPAVAGVRYDDIEELAPADEAPWEAPPAVAGVRYDDIEELASADEPPAKDRPTEAIASVSEDEAWLNLAGEAASMEPSDIWAELADTDEAAEALKQQEVEGDPPLVNSDILERDPFDEKAFEDTTESDSGIPGDSAERYITGYGEFIPVSADLNTFPLNTDSLYSVEEFADADIEDENLYNDVSKENEANYAFNPQQHQRNIDEIAREIEFSAVDQRIAPPANDLDLVISSPLEEIFSAKTVNADNMAAPVNAKPAAPAGKTTKNVREVKAYKLLETAARTPLPQPHYRFFSQKSGDLEYIEAEEDESESSLIKKRGGVDYIDSALLKKGNIGEEKIDPKMKRLVDSVLQNR